MVTMGLIDVDCHNQLMGHLPACSRSGGPSHAHIGSRCRLSTALIFAQHDGGGPPVWWGKSNSGFFLLPSSLFISGKRSLTMHWLIYQDSTLAVSVRKQGREELRKWKPKTGDAHFPCPLVTLLRGAEQRHPTWVCSRAHKLRQHTGVGMG